MLSVRAIYDGKKLQLIDKIKIRKPKEVIITFLDEEGDLWDELPDEVKADVEIAIHELESGKGISHHKMMKKHAKWLKK